MLRSSAHRRRVRRFGAGLVAGSLIGAAVLAGCSSTTDAAPPSAVDRGQLVRAERLRDFSTQDVAAELTAAGFDAGAVRFEVETYRLVYRTVGADGGMTTASGLLALPRNGEHELTTVAYQHGTMATKADGPSVSDHGGDLAAVLSYATAGFASAATDYLGLGVGPGLHPYMDVQSETTAAVDMLRSARTEVAAVDRQLRHEVDVVGFSQGGPAALGLARALQEGAEPWFKAAAVAPISGPYDIRAVALPAILDNSFDQETATFYTAYLLTSWNHLHNLYGSPGEVFQTPYDRTVEGLFDGSHSEEDIVRGLPSSVDKLLTPHGMDMLRTPTGSFADALRTADATCDWTPTMPIRLYMGSKDRTVGPDNSAHCRITLQQHGFDAPIINVGDLDHSDSGKAGTAAAVRWFTELAAAH